MEERKFLNNEELKRYELHVGDKLAVAEYIINNEGVVYMTHTETPVELEGKGVASELIEKSLLDIKEKGRTVYPLCPFVIAYIRRHPEWNSLIKKY